MKFFESGLPDKQAIEDAFNYSYANVMSHKAETLEDYNRQIEAAYQQDLKALEGDKETKIINEEQYSVEKEAYKRLRDRQLKMGPAIVEEELKHMFKSNRLGPALELLKHSDKPSPDLLAAIMLVECVRSPRDYQKIVAAFGDSIAGLIADLHHIDAYPSERATNIAKAGSDTKRAYLALLITSLEHISAHAKRLAQLTPPQKVSFAPGQEESVFSRAKLLAGNDKKLDHRFADCFNRTAEAVVSQYRLETGADGTLDLVKSTLTPPPKKPNQPPKPPGPADNGDDVF